MSKFRINVMVPLQVLTEIEADNAHAAVYAARQRHFILNGDRERSWHLLTQLDLEPKYYGRFIVTELEDEDEEEEIGELEDLPES